MLDEERAFHHDCDIVTSSYLCVIKNVHGDLDFQGGWGDMFSFPTSLQWLLIRHSTILFPRTRDGTCPLPHSTPSLPHRKHLILQNHSSTWKGSFKMALAQAEPQMVKSARTHWRTRASLHPTGVLSPFHTWRSPKSWQILTLFNRGPLKVFTVKQGFNNKNFLVYFK